MEHAPQSLTIRPGYADDELALRRLATLDSAPAVPPAPLLIAEIDDELRAAYSVRDGSAIADPFRPTAALLELLALRAAQLRRAERQAESTRPLRRADARRRRAARGAFA